MNRGNFSQETLARHLIQLVVIPPGFGNVPVGDDTSGIAHRKARAEYVQFHFGAVAPESEYRIAVAILQRLALLVQCRRSAAAGRSADPEMRPKCAAGKRSARRPVSAFARNRLRCSIRCRRALVSSNCFCSVAPCRTRRLPSWPSGLALAFATRLFPSRPRAVSSASLLFVQLSRVGNQVAAGAVIPPSRRAIVLVVLLRSFWAVRANRK